MKISKARYDANKKYNAKTYKRIQADIKISDYDRIEEFCNKYGISKAQFIVRACDYFIAADRLPPQTESREAGAEEQHETGKTV